MRRSADFAGWANEIEYLADEQERQKKAEASIALYRQEHEKPGMFISGKDALIFFGKVLLLAAGLIFTCYVAVIAAAAWLGL